MKLTEQPTDSTSEEPESPTSRRTVLGAIGTAATTVLAGCRVAEESERETATIQYSVSASEVDDISVRGGDGETAVRGWDGSAVRVEATKYARGQTDPSDVTVTREVTNGHLSIEADVSDGIGIARFGGGLETLDVRIPHDTPVAHVGIDDGSGTVVDVAGDLTLEVDDGSAEVGPVDGQLSLTGDDGAVTIGMVDSVTGNLDDGSLEMTDSATLGDLNVDAGELDLAVGDLAGDVTVDGDDADVTIGLDPSIDASVVAEADDTAVRVAGGLFDSLTTADGSTRGQIGDGTDRLTIEVDDGIVRLCPL